MNSKSLFLKYLKELSFLQSVSNESVCYKCEVFIINLQYSTRQVYHYMYNKWIKKMNQTELKVEAT